MKNCRKQSEERNMLKAKEFAASGGGCVPYDYSSHQLPATLSQPAS